MICYSETVHAYATMQAELEQLVIRMLFESYNVEKHADKYIGGTRYLLRLMKYKRLPNGEPNKKFISHTDKSFISILHQNHITGLMLKSEKEDVWYPFTPSPTRFVVIAGDAIMVSLNLSIGPSFHIIINVKSCVYIKSSGVEQRQNQGVLPQGGDGKRGNEVLVRVLFVPKRDDIDTGRNGGQGPSFSVQALSP